MNPWTEIPAHPSYVLADDLPYVEVFNQNCNNPELIVNTRHPPVPRMGPINAPFVILQGNPSFDTTHPEGPIDEELQLALSNLKDETQPHQGALSTDSWWTSRLQPLVDEVGKEQLSHKMLSIEFFPYRSNKFGHGDIRLPSQWYTFSLVKEALARQAVIIVARNWNLWCSAVPGLFREREKTVFQSINPRSAQYNSTHLGRKAFEAILEKIS